MKYNRDISEIPHPFVIESLTTFKELDSTTKNKIIFIHFNHTNPLHYPDSEQYQQVNEMGWEVGTEGMEFVL